MAVRRLYVVLAVLALAASAGVVLTVRSHEASAGQTGGRFDDGKELLPQAGITLSQAIAAAQTAASGAVGEVDLEYWQGKLVFNVDVGDKDVKVDAKTGVVLGATIDD